MSEITNEMLDAVLASSCAVDGAPHWGDNKLLHPRPWSDEFVAMSELAQELKDTRAELAAIRARLDAAGACSQAIR